MPFYFLSILFSMLLYSFTKPIHTREVALKFLLSCLQTYPARAIFWGLGINLAINLRYLAFANVSFHLLIYGPFTFLCWTFLFLWIEVCLCQPVYCWFSASFFSKLQIQEPCSWSRIVPCCIADNLKWQIFCF